MWSCGWGVFGQLGHGDTADKLVLMIVGVEGFRGAQIVMLAAGGAHGVALGAAGREWTWGYGKDGQLGHNNEENRLVPTLLAGEALGEAAAVLVVAGRLELWVWGDGNLGQLGLGDKANRLSPTLVEAEAAFWGSPVLTEVCSHFHTLAVTKDVALWTFGMGDHGALGHNDYITRLLPGRIEAQHFGDVNIVSVACGVWHSAAVTEEGILQW